MNTKRFISALTAFAMTFTMGICASADDVKEEKVFYPYDDTHTVAGEEKNNVYVNDFVEVKGASEQNGYFFFHIDTGLGIYDTAELEITPYSVSAPEGYTPMLLVYSIDNQDMPTYKITASNAPVRKVVQAEFTPVEGQTFTLDVTEYVRGNISQRNNIGFAINDSDNANTEYRFKSSENRDGASLRLIVNRKGGVGENELLPSVSAPRVKRRNLTHDCKEVDFTTDVSGLDIDSYTTTRYKPWLVNYHLTEPFQIDNDYYGGECGQAPYNIAICPYNPNILLIGSDMESVYRTEDGGVTWSFSGDGLKSVGTQGLAFYPDENNIAFAIMGKPVSDDAFQGIRLGQGIYKSTDLGKTWEYILPLRTGYGDSTRKGGSFAFSEPNENGIRRVYAATLNAGIYYSDDLGENWEYLGLNDMSLGFIRVKGDTIITGSRTYGLMFSKDGGKTWINKSDELGSTYVSDCITDPRDGNHWYACVDDTVYESFDDGETWQFMTDVFEMWNECYADGSGASTSRVGWLEFMAPDENGHRTLLSGTIAGRYSIKYSDDYGKTWHTSTLENDLAYIVSNWGSNADPVAVHPYDPGIAWFSFDGEWFKTTDGGKTWFPSASGYSGNRASGFWFDEEDNDNVWISFTDRGFARTIPSGNGEQYPAVTDNMSEDTYDMRFDYRRDVDGVARDPRNKNRYLINGKYGSNLLESLDGGWTWQYINVPSTTAGALMYSSTDPDVIYCGKNISYDNGKTWTAVKYKILECSKIDGNIVWALDTDANSFLYKSYDAGRTWNFVGNIRSTIQNVTADVAVKDKAYIGTFANGIHVDNAGILTQLTGMYTGEGNIRGFYDVAQDPKNPQHLVTCNLDHVNLSPSGGISESFDGGKTWRHVEGMFGFGDAWCMEFHPNLPRVYIGTSHGTFVYEYDKYYDMSEKIYLDTSDSYAKEKIDKLYEKGILNQYHDGNFYPDKNFTRGEFAKMLQKALDLKCVSTKQVFSDVGIRSRDFVAAGALYEQGYAVGGADAVFDGKSNITYDDAAVIMARVLKKYGKSEGVDLSKVNLGGKAQSYAEYAVACCAELKIIENIDTYNGSLPATREDIASMLYNLLEVIGKQ